MRTTCFFLLRNHRAAIHSPDRCGVPPRPTHWDRALSDSIRAIPLRLEQRRHEAHAAAPARLQILRRADRFHDRAGTDRRGRAERLRQVEPGGGAALGDGRDLAQIAARRRHGRRDLFRHQHPAGAQQCRGRHPGRQQRAQGAGAVQRARDPRHLAPDRARAGLDLSHQRPRGARAGRAHPVCRRLDRLALARAGASRAHRRDHPGQARAAPARARGGGRHLRPARAPARGGAAAARRRAEPGAARGRDRPARRPRSTRSSGRRGRRSAIARSPSRCARPRPPCSICAGSPPMPSWRRPSGQEKSGHSPGRRADRRAGRGLDPPGAGGGRAAGLARRRGESRAPPCSDW